MSKPEPNQHADGRLERSVATRRKILEATRELLVDGAQQPTAREIAQAASITPRTLFRHFDDMESLYATLVSEAQADVARVMDEPLPEFADWHEALAQVVKRRVRVYELLLPLYISSAWLRGLTDKNQKYAVRRRRSRLAKILPKNTDPVLFEALDATLSIEFWYSLRKAQNLSVRQAQRTLQRAVDLLTTQEQSQ